MITRTRRVSVTRYNSETFDYQARIIANGGTISAASLAKVDAFITSCKASVLWAKFIEVGVFVGDQLAAALVKLVYPEGGQAVLTNNGFIAGDYNESGANGGLAANGFKYLDTGTIAAPSALAFYNRTEMNNLSIYTMLGVGTDGDATLSALRHVGSADQFDIDGDITEFESGGTTGLYVGSKLADNDRRLYLNGVQLTVNQTAGVFTNEPNKFFVFARNVDGAPSDWWPGKGSFYALCEALTPEDNQNLYNAVQALQISFNRNV